MIDLRDALTRQLSIERLRHIDDNNSGYEDFRAQLLDEIVPVLSAREQAIREENKAALSELAANLASKFETGMTAAVARYKKAEAELHAATQALDVWAPLDADEPKSLAQRITDEGHDFGVLLDHLTRTYDHFSLGRISKPMTLPSEVFAVAEDFLSEDIREAVKEATEEIEVERDAARAGLARLREWLEGQIARTAEAMKSPTSDGHCSAWANFAFVEVLKRIENPNLDDEARERLRAKGLL